MDDPLVAATVARCLSTLRGCADGADPAEKYWYVGMETERRTIVERLAAAAFAPMPFLLKRLVGGLAAVGAATPGTAAIVDGVAGYIDGRSLVDAVVTWGPDGTPFRLSGSNPKTVDGLPYSRVEIHRLDPDEPSRPYPARVGEATMDRREFLRKIGQPTLTIPRPFAAESEVEHLLDFLDGTRPATTSLAVPPFGSMAPDEDFEALLALDGGIPGAAFRAVVEESDDIVTRATLSGIRGGVEECLALTSRSGLEFGKSLLAYADTDCRVFPLLGSRSTFHENVDLISDWSSFIVTLSEDDDGPVTTVHALSRSACDRHAVLSAFDPDSVQAGTRRIRLRHSDGRIEASPGARGCAMAGSVLHLVESAVEALKRYSSGDFSTAEILTDFEQYEADHDPGQKAASSSPRM